MGFKKELIESGLKEKEAIVYDILISQGILPVKSLIQKSSLKKGILYKTLYDLEKKGLVSQIKISGVLHFQAEHPYNLAEIVDRDLDRAKKTAFSINELLPLLLASYKASGAKPGVQFYDGIAGVKLAIEDTLKEEKEVFAIYQVGEVHPDIYQWFEDYYWEARKSKSIKMNVIVAEDYLTESYVKTNDTYLRETRVIPADRFHAGAIILIYGEKVSFINSNKNSDLFAITVTNHFIKESTKPLFDLAWESAKKYEELT